MPRANRNPSQCSAPAAVLKLCETFAGHRDHFRSGNYNEAQLRKEFLDPFFQCLGWDMDNTQGLAPQYRDVIHEDALKIGPAHQGPGLRVHPARPAQILPRSQETVGQYQGRHRPGLPTPPLCMVRQTAAFHPLRLRGIRHLRHPRQARAERSDRQGPQDSYCTFDQYAGQMGRNRREVFSRDAILKGSFDKYAGSSGKKKGTAEVDAAIPGGNRTLARPARHTATSPCATRRCSARDLNFAVQKTIDRLVFLRICEDRGTKEDYGRLRAVANGGQCYPRLLEVFQKADEPATTPACSTSPAKKTRPRNPTRSRPPSSWTTRRSRTSSAT